MAQAKQIDSIDEVLTRMFSLHRLGVKPGLERIGDLLHRMGNPQNMFPSIHVAGTNGKGSVCSLLASILTSAGYRVGLYTSPHLLRFNERIRINGKEISDQEIMDILNVGSRLHDAEKNKTTFFELTTALAMQYFADSKVDIAIIETGMGGRLDATNVLTPLLSIITSIDYDHSEYLGLTLDAIAGEKAGIIKQSIPVVVSELRPSLRDVFESRAKMANTTCHFPLEEWSIAQTAYRKDFSMLLDISAPMGELKELEVSVAGEHQTVNVVTALYALRMLLSLFPVSESAVREGLRNLNVNSGLQARIQLLRPKPPLVLDVAHNTSGMKQLVRTLRLCGYGEVEWNIVFGAMSDKKVVEMLMKIHPAVGLKGKFFGCAPNVDRALPLSMLEEAATSVGFPTIQICESVAEAVTLAIATKKPTIIAGSFYVADEALRTLRELDIVE